MEAYDHQRTGWSNSNGSATSRSNGSDGSTGSRTQVYTGGWTTAPPSHVQTTPTSFASTHPYESASAPTTTTRDIANMMAASRTRALSSSMKAQTTPAFPGANSVPVYRAFPSEEYLTSRRYSSSVVSRSPSGLVSIGPNPLRPRFKMKPLPKAGFEEAEEQRIRDESKRSLKTGRIVDSSYIAEYTKEERQLKWGQRSYDMEKKHEKDLLAARARAGGLRTPDAARRFNISNRVARNKAMGDPSRFTVLHF